ncbi:hypothetical protein JW979_06080 [bacterium]|nr:hypothetical protein [candidate division CSSED10-310 bacterium]
MRYTASLIGLILTIFAVPVFGYDLWSSDVLVTADFTSVAYYQHPKLSTAENGDIYCAVERHRVSGYADQVAVFRSQDGGYTWNYGVAFNVVADGYNADTYHPDIAVYRSGNTNYGLLVLHYYHPVYGDMDVASRAFNDDGSPVLNWLDVAMVAGTDNEEYRPTVTYTGSYFVCGYAVNNYGTGNAEARIARTNSLTGGWVEQLSIIMSGGYIPEHTDIETLRDGSDGYVYFTYFYRISSGNANHNIDVAFSTNHGANGSWAWFLNTPQNTAVDEIDPDLACTKDATGQKIVLTYAAYESAFDSDIYIRTAEKSDTGFGSPMIVADTATQDLMPMICVDPPVSGDSEMFHLAWFQDDTVDDAIMYSQFAAVNAVPSLSAPERVDDGNSSPWDGWDAGFSVLDVSWKTGTSGKCPVVAWIDDRNDSKYQGTPGPYVSFPLEGSVTPTPVTSPSPTSTSTPVMNSPTPQETPTPTTTEAAVTETPTTAAVPAASPAGLCLLILMLTVILLAGIVKRSV